MRGYGKTLSLFLITILTLSGVAALFLVIPAEGQGGQFTIAPPFVQFSKADGSVLFNVGNFNVAFIASGCSSNDLMMAAYLRSVSYRTSWQNYDIEVFHSGEKSNLDPNGFFCTVDLSHVPLGAQQIIVTVTSESDIFSIFTKTSQTAIHFNITAPPQKTTVPPASNWNVNKVAENIADTTNFPVALDSNGIPQIAYTGFGVEYAKWNGFSWSTQTVDLGYVDSFALDAEGMSHILYWGWGNSGLKYASWTGSNWTIQTVDPSINGYVEVGALALDSSGDPHVAYINGTTVQYASWTGSNWTKQIVDTYPEIRAPISLALDSFDNPQILYDCPTFIADNGLVGTDENQMGLHSFYTYYHFRLASWNGTNWGIQNITYANDPESSLVLDSKNNAHMVYKVDHSFENSTLMYDSWNGTVWNAQEVISNVSLFNTGFLALDSNDKPHIVYIGQNGTLQYAAFNGKTWSSQTVNTNITANGPCFLTLDSAGNPHITFLGPTVKPEYTAAIGPIIYASITEPTPISTPISQHGEKNLPSYVIWLGTAFAAAIIAIAILLVAVIYRRSKSAKSKLSV